MESSQIKEVVQKHRYRIGILVLFLLTTAAFSYAFYRITKIDKHLTAISEELASTTLAFYSTTDALSANFAVLGNKAEDISQTLLSTKEDVMATQSSLSDVKNKVGGVENVVGSLSGTVSTLEKLSTIDLELLKKYSKVYFLNENYTPAHLSVIPQKHVYSNTKQEEYLSEAMPFLQKLLSASAVDNATIYIASAYRSFGKQVVLKSEYSIIYGVGTANTFSADQGYSEHQLGTAVDFITTGLGGQLTTDFDQTDAFGWLQNNAYKYGFELSYPKGNVYYIYEPWHWRFVGVKLATYLHENSMNFYDMDQRDIDIYLATLFD